MPWRETEKMEERMAFISDWRRLVRSDPQGCSMAELCRNYGVSRKSGYALVGRYLDRGVSALSDASHAAHTHPNAVTGLRERAVVAVRQEHPTWGPKKIKAWLERRRPGQVWPAESTIGEILDRHGLVKRRRLRRLHSMTAAGFLRAWGGNVTMPPAPIRSRLQNPGYRTG